MRYIVEKESYDDIKTPEEFLKSKEYNDQSIIHEIPQLYRNNLREMLSYSAKQSPNSELNTTVFTHRNQNALRFEMIFKATIQQIKMQYQVNKNFLQKMPIELRSTLKYDFNTFKKNMPTLLPNIIDNAIKFTDYFEEGKCEPDLIKFFTLGYNVKENEQYDHRLENFYYNYLNERVDLFLENYLNEEKDKKLSHEEIYTALKNTFELAHKTILDVFEEKYKNNKLYEEAYQYQLEMLAISKERIDITNTGRLSDFKTKLKKSKMNYIMRYEGKYIYPFLVDFITIRFHLMIMVLKLHNKVIDTSYKSNDKLKVKSKGTNQAYRKAELRLLEIFAKYFNNANLKKTEYNPIETNVTIFLIYYYSQVLDTNYTDIESVIKQLIYKSTREPIELDNGQKISPKNRYQLKPKYKERFEQLDIIHDEFRNLSLYII